MYQKRAKKFQQIQERVQLTDWKEFTKQVGKEVGIFPSFCVTLYEAYWARILKKASHMELKIPLKGLGNLRLSDGFIRNEYKKYTYMEQEGDNKTLFDPEILKRLRELIDKRIKEQDEEVERYNRRVLENDISYKEGISGIPKENENN